VRIDLSVSRLRIPTKLREVGAALNVDPVVWMLTGGDDYALAGTFPESVELPDSWEVIGTVAEGEGVRVDGRRWRVGGHEHYR
jgi:thiamine-monophosphate kinase